MALAVSFNAAKQRQFRHEGDKPGVTGGTTITPFFGSRHLRSAGAADQHIPDATLAQFDAGKISRPHFHRSDQFQVLIDGTGSLGRHRLAPYSIHFSRSYTPYGPLVAGNNGGMTLFILRAHPDPGSQRLPQERNQLLAAHHREPWQMTCTVDRASKPSHADVDLQPIAGLRDDHGLAAYTLRMQPGAQTFAPDPRLGDGQFIMVVKGGVVHEQRELAAYALIFSKPDDGPFNICATQQGLEALILNFPVPRTAADAASHVRAESNTWRCSLCSFAYDERTGLPADRIAPGTRWEELPQDWTCPDCAAPKSEFKPA